MGHLILALSNVLRPPVQLFHLLLGLQLLEEVEGALQLLLLLVEAGPGPLHGRLHLAEALVLHRLPHVLEGLLQVFGLHLVDGPLQLLKLLAGFRVGEVLALHFAVQGVHLPGEVGLALREGLLFLLQPFELAAVFPVGLPGAAQLPTEVLELLLNLPGPPVELPHLLAGVLLQGVELFVLLGQRGEAEALRRRAAAFRAVHGVVIPRLRVVDDLVPALQGESAFLGQEPRV